MVSKMVTIKDLKYINLDDFSKKLDDFGIDTLTIFFFLLTIANLINYT
jgi:hypothetical protein